MMRVTLVGTAFCLLQAVREIAALFPGQASGRACRFMLSTRMRTGA
jgi:hypothetical protein